MRSKGEGGGREEELDNGMHVDLHNYLYFTDVHDEIRNASSNNLMNIVALS